VTASQEITRPPERNSSRPLTLDDLDRGDLSRPPPRTGRMYKAVLDDRLLAEPGDLEGALADRGLSPHPALLLVLEGETEMLLMPRVLTELYGKLVPPALIDPVNMKSIDCDLDLLVRHVAGPKLGNDHGDFVLLMRSPTASWWPSIPRRGSPRSNSRGTNVTSWSGAFMSRSPLLSGPQKH
jgi:hypothetical protein